MQELGLAREFEALNISTFIFILEKKIKSLIEKKISNKITIVYIPCVSLGSHGVFNCKFLKKYKIDIVHLLGDNQFFVSKVIKFCKFNNIYIYNYIGTIGSSKNKNIISSFLLKMIKKRNIKLFKKIPTYAKNPTIKSELEKEGVINVKLAPVALDYREVPYITEDKTSLRKKLDLPLEKHMILFIGRLEHYKKPFDAIHLMEKLNSNFVLVIIGDGSLLNQLKFNTQDFLKDRIYFTGSIPNKEIHYYLKTADYFINFNQDEIFGMAILEAMYHNCTVIAKHAPGPDFIIENGRDGYLVNSIEEMVDIITNNKKIGLNVAYEKVCNNFLWKQTVSIFYNDISKFLGGSR